MKLKSYMMLYRTAIVKIANSSVHFPLPPFLYTLLLLPSHSSASPLSSLHPSLSPPSSLLPPLLLSPPPSSPLLLPSQVRVGVEEALQDVADVIRNPEIAAIKGE